MNLFILKEWLIYFHLKTDEHSLHSPFFYDFYTSLIRNKTCPDTAIIETIRQGFLSSQQTIDLNDLGAGSQISTGKDRKLSSIAKYSLSSKKFSLFLLKLINKYQPNTILELGTSLGINTAYMAQYSEAQIISFEGDRNMVALANKHLSTYNHVKVIEGNIDNTLAECLMQLTNPVDLVYIDANHTYEASLHYFELLLPHFQEHSICIFDDIHWSKGMKKAWQEVQQHPQVTASIDLFDAGILFFNPTLNQQHLILNF